MLFILFFCIYISFFCWAWGVLTLQSLKKICDDSAYPVPHFSFTCIIGLSIITVVGGILSLFIPLGKWEIQIIIILPAALFLFKKNRLLLHDEIKKALLKLSPLSLFIFIAGCLLILIMSSWKVNHPDTLYYHIQTIKWIEKYKAVPGLVHLHVRYGYQGLWFVSSALFSFSFTGIETFITLNFTVLVWFFLFISYKIHQHLFEKFDARYFLSWLALLVISMISYTQVRLTATSASSDFIAAIYIWLIFYLVMNNSFFNNAVVHKLIIIFLSVFAISIKLSAAPVLIIAAFMFYQLFSLKKIKAIIISSLCAITVLLPFAARNVISSGYVVFPSVIPDIVHVDWKFNKGLTVLEKDYITAYAKGIREGSKNEMQVNADTKKITEWMPFWWSSQSLMDKILLLLMVVSLAGLFIKAKRLFTSSHEIIVAAFCTVTGILFWFIQAPDPRFGFGFIIILPALASNLFNFQGVITKKIAGIISIITGLFISAYIIYRTVYFFGPRQLLLPEGVASTHYSTVQCNGSTFNIPGNDTPCGDTEIPCAYNDCSSFEMRGNKITDGFRSK